MIKNDDGSITVEDTDLDLEADTKTDDINLSPIEDSELKKSLQTTIAKKKAWRAKAFDETTGKTYKELYESTINNPNTQEQVETKPVESEKKEEATNDILKDVASLKEDRQMRVFQHANNLTPEQVDELFGYAKGMGIEPKDALEKPFMKKVLSQMSSDEASANAVLNPSRRAPTQVGGKTFKEMSSDERRSAFSTFTKGK